MRILVFLLINLLPLFVLAQKLSEDKKDEFTGAQVKRTEFEQLISNMKFTTIYSFVRSDTTFKLDVKLQLGTGELFSITKGDEFMLKTSNDSVVKSPCIESAVSCKGSWSNGLSGSNQQNLKTSFTITKDQMNILQTRFVRKIKLYTIKGATEDEIKHNKAETFFNKFFISQLILNHAKEYSSL
jgi:hypothetical protein